MRFVSKQAYEHAKNMYQESVILWLVQQGLTFH